MATSTNHSESNRLYRSENNKIIAGVAGGLGEYFAIDPTIIRIIFIILAIFHGSGLLIYIIMWIILPMKSRLDSDNETSIKDNVDEIKNKAKSLAHDIHLYPPKHRSNSNDSHFLWAILIIVFGFFFLFRNFGIFDALDLGKFWPLILIILGLVFILRR